MRCKKMLLLGVAAALSACGGESNDGSGSSIGKPVPVDPQTGVFIDSPVANVDYTNASGNITGTTNAAGEFQFQPLETMTFSIGALKFPASPAVAKFTPMNMVRTSDITSPYILNIVRLLMTLDQDGNPDNGITITDQAKAVATQVDFFVPEAEFEVSGAVTNLIYNAGQNTVVSGLVSSADALAHFEASLIQNGIDYGTQAQKDERIITQYLTDNNLTATRDEETGIYYSITLEGTGDSPLATSTVVVKYKGYFTDGTVFDQTTGDNTAQFNLGEVIPGFTVAIQLLKPGGKGTFYLPSAYAYGQQGSGSIPPNTVLIFDVELISFQ